MNEKNRLVDGMPRFALFQTLADATLAKSGWIDWAATPSVKPEFRCGRWRPSALDYAHHCNPSSSAYSLQICANWADHNRTWESIKC